MRERLDFNMELIFSVDTRDSTTATTQNIADERNGCLLGNGPLKNTVFVLHSGHARFKRGNHVLDVDERILATSHFKLGECFCI